MITKRQKKVLFALIEEFNKTSKPVSSNFLASKIELSPSMLRYELRTLEEMEYIKKNNYSSGRSPTNKAYVLFINNFEVDQINIKDIETDEKLAKVFSQIEALFQMREKRIDDVLSESLNLVTSITKTIIWKEPQYNNVTVQDLSFYIIEDKEEINVIFIFSNGEIRNQILPFNADLKEDLLKSLSLYRKKIKGESIAELETKLTAITNNIDETFKVAENLLFSLTKNILTNIATKPKVENLNSLVNSFVDSSENTFMLQNLIHLLQTKSIWEIIDESKQINSKNHLSFFLEFKDEKFVDNSLIKKEFNVNGKSNTFFILGAKNQNYKVLLKILYFIEKKLSET